MLRDELKLQNLISLEQWQKVQDSFSDVLEVTLRTVSADGEPLTNPSRPTRVCTELLLKISNGNTFCNNCMMEQGSRYHVENITEDSNFKCPLNLDVFVVPIKAIGSAPVAYVIIGPLIFKKRKDIAECAKDAQKLGITAEELMDALIEINVFSYNKVHSIINLIKEVFSDTIKAAYHKKRLGEIAPEVIQIDPLFSKYYEEKVLSALLNACTLALDVDSGSVMTLDKATKTLHIKAARKLDEDIVNKTNLKIGDGIAGFAAATAKSIILPKDTDKNNLANKMKRKYIKSSMIVPFHKGSSHDVYGVINLNMTRKDVDFSDRDVAIVKELISMASIALIPVKS